MRALALIPFVLVLAACGATEPESAPTTEAAPPPMAVGAPVVYEANTTVLEDALHGPMLCLGPALDTLPPQCGSVVVANWNWEAVEGEEVRSGTTWGEFHVEGTYDGETFTLVEAGPVEPGETIDDPSFEIACDAPGEGAREGKTTDDDVGDVDVWAQGQKHYVASWITYLDENVAEEVDAGNEGPFPVVYNLIVDADAADIEAEARERWDGPLCVVERDVPPFKEAQRIRAEAEASLEGYGLQMLWSNEGDVGQAAEIGVAADPGGAGQAIMDDRFGPGLIHLVPALLPVN